MLILQVNFDEWSLIKYIMAAKAAAEWDEALLRVLACRCSLRCMLVAHLLVLGTCRNDSSHLSQAYWPLIIPTDFETIFPTSFDKQHWYSPTSELSKGRLSKCSIKSSKILCVLSEVTNLLLFNTFISNAAVPISSLPNKAQVSTTSSIGNSFVMEGGSENKN